MRFTVVLGAIASLAGCAPSQCDPSQAGFFSGIGCEASGSYTTRNRYQQSALAEQSANALQARAASGQERSRASDAILTRNELQSRLSVVDADTARLRARLAAARARGNVDSARLNAAEAELNALQQERRRTSNSVSEEDIRALNARQRRAAEAAAGI